MHNELLLHLFVAIRLPKRFAIVRELLRYEYWLFELNDRRLIKRLLLVVLFDCKVVFVVASKFCSDFLFLLSKDFR